MQRAAIGTLPRRAQAVQTTPIGLRSRRLINSVKTGQATEQHSQKAIRPKTAVARRYSPVSAKPAYAVICSPELRSRGSRATTFSSAANLTSWMTFGNGLSHRRAPPPSWSCRKSLIDLTRLEEGAAVSGLDPNRRERAPVTAALFQSRARLHPDSSPRRSVLRNGRRSCRRP